MEVPACSSAKTTKMRLVHSQVRCGITAEGKVCVCLCMTTPYVGMCARSMHTMTMPTRSTLGQSKPDMHGASKLPEAGELGNVRDCLEETKLITSLMRVLPNTALYPHTKSTVASTSNLRATVGASETFEKVNSKHPCRRQLTIFTA